MIAAAQSIVAVESICTHPEKAVAGSRGATAMSTAVNYAGAIVCTVGEIHSWPGASNVIPGEVHIQRITCSVAFAVFYEGRNVTRLYKKEV